MNRLTLILSVIIIVCCIISEIFSLIAGHYSRKVEEILRRLR